MAHRDVRYIHGLKLIFIKLFEKPVYTLKGAGGGVPWVQNQIMENEFKCLVVQLLKGMMEHSAAAQELLGALKKLEMNRFNRT